MPSTNNRSRISGSSTADEQRLLDEVLDLVTTFGPLDGAVKIKLPNCNNYLLVHGHLFIEKSFYCCGTLARREKKGGPKVKELFFPSASVTTLAHFLKRIYNSTVVSSAEATPMNHPEHKVAWPDLVNVWLFASSIDLPALQNHAVEILVRKMHSFLKVEERTQNEIDLIRAAFNLIWRGKNQAQSETEQRKSDKPLRALMNGLVCEPTWDGVVVFRQKALRYQTKTNAGHLWAGGLSRSFYRDFALHALRKNFSKVFDDARDGNDAQAHLNPLRGISQHRFAGLWEIRPEKYHVKDFPWTFPSRTPQL